MPIHRCALTLCSCQVSFQGDNFKKHIARNDTHTKEKRILFCVSCNERGNEGDTFRHQSCPHVTLSKSDMKLLLGGGDLPNREALVEEAKAKRVAKAKAKEPVDEKENKERIDEWLRRETEAAVASISPPPQVPEEGVEGERLDNESVIVQRKNHHVDLDDSSSSSSLAFQPKRRRCSTPNAPFVPRLNACPATQLAARRSLVDSNKKLEAIIKDLRQRLALKEAKETNAKRCEEECQRRGEEVKRLAEELKEEKMAAKKEREERERERHAFEEWKTEMARALEEEKKRSEEEKMKSQILQEKTAELERQLRDSRDSRGTPSWCRLHLALRHDRIIDSHVEEDADSSCFCFSCEVTKTRCLHVDVTGHAVSTHVKNTRWPSERKNHIVYLLTCYEL